MSTLTVTSRGQVTFRKEVLQHLGIQPGEKIEVDLLPDGRAELRAARAGGSFHQLRGVLKGKTNGARLTIEEIDEAIAKAGAKAGAGKA
jgi:AbrB family looped-hinge helix DNA binding protein